MPPLPKKEAENREYDYFVIGGGSGGFGTARRAASYGAKVGLAEQSPHLGGTCVNVGCVPKKIMWQAAEHATGIHKAVRFGLGNAKLADEFTKDIDWNTMVQRREAFIRNLNKIYEKNLANEHVDEHSGHAKILDKHTIEITQRDGEKYTIKTKKICIATGGYPTVPGEDKIPGAKYGIDSDGFFALEQRPKRVVVVGAGYIAVELTGIFNALGSEAHLVIRHDQFLRTFDPMCSEVLMPHMEHEGVHIHKSSNVTKVEKTSSGALSIHIDSLSEPVEADCLLWCIGRHGNTDNLGLENVGVKTNEKGDIVVDEYQNTNVDGIYAVGDIGGKALLTPVAIAAGRRLSNRLFGGDKYKDDKLSYENIPSVVFSHPPIGAIGLTEPEAKEKYGDKLKIYKSTFRGLSQSLLEQDQKVSSTYKLICAGEDEKVVGLHIIGDGSDEVLQGFGVAIKMGATKEDFDSCVAIHPTSAEELVTLR
ncbi:putative glutathione-disulfide reductase [Kockovaella imperatae]|uniref:Glutathione reductase n=1 Tax=Kockovaella imperatae TaxID=4999 RepID=A0A1Y1UIH3_9TREE|nr:putative glutathione-disulfide reductase [Kockovaella imperatae]ORX37850.1 putative glutathione-disulfide reductase [Kockovaella imperatae]